jgi:hypothetical protein
MWEISRFASRLLAQCQKRIARKDFLLHFDPDGIFLPPMRHIKLALRKIVAPGQSRPASACEAATYTQSTFESETRQTHANGSYTQ